MGPGSRTQSSSSFLTANNAERPRTESYHPWTNGSEERAAEMVIGGPKMFKQGRLSARPAKTLFA